MICKSKENIATEKALKQLKQTNELEALWMNTIFCTLRVSLVHKHSCIQHGQKSMNQLNKKGSTASLRGALALSEN